MKTGVVACLEEHLAQLVRGVQEWGGQVFRARDAIQARDFILGVARRHGVRTCVKSKSMTTEELALRPFLEQGGLTVTETDLGEFLVQLAGDAPAHLTAPAMHLDRRRIAALLTQHLGLSCAADPQLLTAAASRHLSPHYPQADLGITGVNFAAAAEATLVMLENEGNLRQTATLPRVHMAVMGLEKVIPTLADIEACLQLLPASATGQRLTSLVHFLKGVKAGPTGPQAFYLVLLDNGRSRLARDPELAGALACLRCGACLNVCPVFQAGGAHLYRRTYPGAIGILLAPFLAPVGDIASLCTQCGACGEICPAGIPLPELILAVRRRSQRFAPYRFLSRGAGVALSHPPLYRGLAQGARWVESLRRRAGRAPLGFTLAPHSFHTWQTSTEALPPSFLGGEGRGGGEISSRRGNVSPSPQPPPTRGGEKDEQGNCKLYLGHGTMPATAEASGPGGLAEPAAPNLAERLAEVGSALHRLASVEDLVRLVGRDGKAPLVVAAGPDMPDLAAALAKRGLETHSPADLAGADADALVLVALGAIPETGSVIMADPAGLLARLACRARRLIFLVPPESADLSLAQALEVTRQAPGPLVTWHTGPTRTADIEKVLVLGAQGPVTVEVVIWGETQ
jgi:L-lactate dehydrogenase complex protein LldF